MFCNLNANDQPFNKDDSQYPLKINSNGSKHKNKNKTLSSKQLSFPFKHFQKIKKCNKKIRSIQSGKSKELNNILLKYKLKRDSKINFVQKELKHKLNQLRETANQRQSQIITEKQQQTKLLSKRIIKELQKIKEKIQAGNTMQMQDIKTEINSVFHDSVENINHISSRRITRNRAKSHYSHVERRKNIDFAKYKFGLTPSEISQDLKYLIIKQENENYSYNNNTSNNISLGFISHPTGFLNDRHLFSSQLSGMCYKTRSRRLTANRSRRIIKEMIDNDGDCGMDHDHVENGNCEMENGQKCIFEKADEVDTDYVINYNGRYDQDDEIGTNSVFIDHVRFTSGDKIRIIENNVNGNEDNVLCGVIKCVMKYHMKVIMNDNQNGNNNKPKRIRYKDISQGHFSVFLQA